MTGIEFVADVLVGAGLGWFTGGLLAVLRRKRQLRREVRRVVKEARKQAPVGGP